MSTNRGPTKQYALRLANDIVAGQGTVFIREFLRSQRAKNRNVRIGTTKAMVLDNLREAIETDAISPRELMEWLDDVEGWGQHHVYLYRPPAAFVGNGQWSPETLEDNVQTAGYGPQWQARSGHDFPKQVTLRSITFDGETLQLTWHQAHAHWERDEAQDKPPEEIDGDDYEFRAYRHAHQRMVTRFVFLPKARKAALFIPLPLGPDHGAMIRTAHETFAEIFPDAPALTPVPLVQAINVLEGEALERLNRPIQFISHGQADPHHTTFRAHGASVAFDSHTAKGYAEVQAVRRVRRAVRAEDFASASSKFKIRLKRVPGLERSVIMSLSGEERRIYFFARMTAEEVWLMLDRLLAVSR